jgi:hypothetical protein
MKEGGMKAKKTATSKAIPDMLEPKIVNNPKETDA